MQNLCHIKGNEMSARVLIVVNGGVAEYVFDGDVDVEIFDVDNYEAGDDITIPASFADLASVFSSIPDECIEKE